MDVNVVGRLRNDTVATDAAKLISRCVHCGFCATACPTYELEHNELDSPRGRIYLVKQLLEQSTDAKIAQKHLDRCLTCRACESACPSGVEYARIAQAGRQLTQRDAPRKFGARMRRRLIADLFRSRFCSRWLRRLSRIFGPLLPLHLRRALPSAMAPRAVEPPKSPRGKVAVFAGCAQEGLMPTTNRALIELLSRAGFETRLVTKVPCCGALRWHTGQHNQALADVRATLSVGADMVRDKFEAIMFASSGCASFVTEYPHLIGLTAAEQNTATQLVSKLADPAAFLLNHLDLIKPQLASCGQSKKVVVHVPCTQRNGLKVPDATAKLLAHADYAIANTSNAPECCGSAGTYSLLESQYAKRLRSKMLNHLENPDAQLIASANIGCVLHLRQTSALPVQHWLDMIIGDLKSN